MWNGELSVSKNVSAIGYILNLFQKIPIIIQTVKHSTDAFQNNAHKQGFEIVKFETTSGTLLLCETHITSRFLKTSWFTKKKKKIKHVFLRIINPSITPGKINII